MSDQSSRLRLSYLAPAQAQKHVTVNETFLRLDGLGQLSARSAQIGAQPGAPTDGDIYLLPPGKTGADWGAMANRALAHYRDGVWEELTPKAGWRCFVEDEEALYARGANAWLKIAASDERRLIFTPGGDGEVSIYRIDTQRAQNPRTANIASVAGDAITLTTPNAGLFFDDAFMANVSYVRIWNITKSPNQSAWVRRQPSSTKLLVLDASAISDWSAGDVVQIGDPTNQTPNRVIAIDISPMMQNVLGRVFPQAGLQLKASVEGVGAAGILDTSSDGQTGSFSGVRSEQSGSRLSGQHAQLTGISSSISSSNLLFVRETASGGTIALTALSVIGLWCENSVVTRQDSLAAIFDSQRNLDLVAAGLGGCTACSACVPDKLETAKSHMESERPGSGPAALLLGGRRIAARFCREQRTRSRQRYRANRIA